MLSNYFYACLGFIIGTFLEYSLYKDRVDWKKKYKELLKKWNSAEAYHGKVKK